MPGVGDVAPAFSLKDHTGSEAERRACMGRAAHQKERNNHEEHVEEKEEGSVRKNHERPKHRVDSDAPGVTGHAQSIRQENIDLVLPQGNGGNDFLHLRHLAKAMTSLL